MALTQRGTTIEQKTRTLTLGDVAAALATEPLDVPAIAVVGRAVDSREQLSWWESKPLFGWKVLVPRTKDQAGSMTDRLMEYGAASDVVPTISVEPPRTPQQMELSLIHISEPTRRLRGSRMPSSA